MPIKKKDEVVGRVTLTDDYEKFVDILLENGYKVEIEMETEKIPSKTLPFETDEEYKYHITIVKEV